MGVPLAAPPVVAQAFAGARGVDCLTPLTFESASRLRGAGYQFAVQYLEVAKPDGLSGILAAHMAVMLVGESREAGWTPTPTLGDADGVRHVTTVRTLCAALGVDPANLTIWCDLEGWVGPPTGAVSYVNSWASVVKQAGLIAGLYVGYADHPLTPSELWGLAVQRYWHSCSIVPPVLHAGYCMTQLAPPNQTIAGVLVDVDEIKADLLGRLPTWLTLPMPDDPPTLPAVYTWTQERRKPHPDALRVGLSLL